MLRKTLGRLRRALLGIRPGDLELSDLPDLLKKDDPVILDIGCNEGDHTSQFLSLFPRSRVFAFEPDPRAIERFKEKIKDPRAALYEYAIADRDGEAAFNMSSGKPPGGWPQEWDLSGSLYEPKTHLEEFPWCAFENSIVVPVKRLDTWLSAEGIEQIDLIWADTQGAEMDLIRGGMKTLERTRYFYTEYSNKELFKGQLNLRELLRMIPDYSVLTRYEQDVLLKNTTISL